jgi:hypothetical protein
MWKCGGKVSVVALALLLAVVSSNALVIRFGGVPNDSSTVTTLHNGALLNKTLNALRPGDELVFPNTTYYLMGGIIASNLRDVVLRFEGSLVFSNNTDLWPRTAGGRVLECMHFDNIQDVTFTSSSMGRLDGQGEVWWGYLGYVEYRENRPRLLSIAGSRGILIENLLFTNSPYWTVWIYDVDGLEIRFSEIINRRDDHDGHDLWNLGYVPLKLKLFIKKCCV